MSQNKGSDKGDCSKCVWGGIKNRGIQESGKETRNGGGQTKYFHLQRMQNF